MYTKMCKKSTWAQDDTFTILTSIPAKCKMGAAFFSNKVLAFLQRKCNYDYTRNNLKNLTDLLHSEGNKSV